MKQLNFGQLFSIFTGLFAFITLAFPKSVSIMVILLTILIIYGHFKKQFSWKLSWPAVFFAALYIAYFIGIFFSADKAEGWKYAEYKMSLFILPLLLSVVPKFNFKFNYSAYGLVAGVLVLTVIGIQNSLNCYSGHESTWLRYCFTSSFISPVHHPSYFAGFILFSFAALCIGKKRKWWGVNGYTIFVYAVVALIMYLLCLSLAGMLFLGLVLATTCIVYLYKKMPIKWFIPFSILAITITILIGSNLPVIKEDIKSTSKTYSQFISDPDGFLYSQAEEEVVSGNTVRLIIWKVATELIIEYPFGVGTGSVDEHINKRLERYGLDQLAEESYNPHNQYLQTTLEIGFIGLILFLGLITSVTYFGIKHRSYLLLLLIAGFAFNCLFESMFQRQSGIIFYSFWIPLLIIELNHKMKKVKAEGMN